jgi:hypothetical protein
MRESFAEWATKPSIEAHDGAADVSVELSFSNKNKFIIISIYTYIYIPPQSQIISHSNFLASKKSQV